jgi:hypothetical protein
MSKAVWQFALLVRSSPNNERLIQDKSKVREEIGDLLD